MPRTTEELNQIIERAIVLLHANTRRVKEDDFWHDDCERIANSGVEALRELSFRQPAPTPEDQPE
ncbi:hypothetical protein GYB59_02085 [bacterium]|nr:hypothetical protein [bacterium]